MSAVGRRPTGKLCVGRAGSENRSLTLKQADEFFEIIDLLQCADVHGQELRCSVATGASLPEEGVFRLHRALAADGSQVLWGESAADDADCFEHPECGYSMPAATAHNFTLHCESLLDEALLAASGARPVVRRLTPRERAVKPLLGENAAIVICQGTRQCIPEFEWRTSDTFALSGVRAEKGAALAKLLNGGRVSVAELLRGRTLVFDEERVLLRHTPTQRCDAATKVVSINRAVSKEVDTSLESSSFGTDEGSAG